MAVDTLGAEAESEMYSGVVMKVMVVVFGASLFAASLMLAQEQTPPASSNPTLTYQERPSVMDQAQASAWQPRLESQVTYAGPLAELLRGENILQSRRRATNVVYGRYDDISVDLITGRPRGVVLFAINF